MKIPVVSQSAGSHLLFHPRKRNFGRHGIGSDPAKCRGIAPLHLD